VLPADLTARLHRHLSRIYGEPRASPTSERLAAMLAKFADSRPGTSHMPDRWTTPFDESDVVLIAYGDQVTEPGQAPLATLRRFLARHTKGVVSGLHLLPHYPSTSDDGFAVADYAAVDPALGDWSDVEALATDHRLMLDAVFNHTSASHPWFTGWLSGDPTYAGFYRSVDPDADLGPVVRPRTTPLLTRFDAPEGPRWAWTTFSADQVDLDYGTPEVLLAVTAELLRYVAHGAQMIRLDAVAFLWKEAGTPCIHLPRTHEIIRLWRTVLDAVAPGTLLVTETNVPHEENLSYLGNGRDEAHVVYQFALPPLTLHSFRCGDASRLAAWARELTTPSAETTYLNFLASHDGIGVRPVEGILSEAEVEDLCAGVLASGGRVSYRDRADGGRSPYELNAVFLDALRGSDPEPLHREVDRFGAAHAIQLALAGIPLLYFQSLFGSRNWTAGVDATGRARTINRQRFARAELEDALADPSSPRRQVRDRLLDQVRTRVAEPAFHPSAPQSVLATDAAYLALQRTRLADDATVVCVHDVSGRPGRCRVRPADRLPPGATMLDLTDGSSYVVEADGTLDVDVPGYGVRWLRPG
jgi:sucrose phosphorylase